MGEVYAARDTKLDRRVAIKVLPAELSQDPERLARFEREAKLLASLNHPNIAHVYGFENATLEDGTSSLHFLAMELVEGEDLSARLERGRIPVDEVVAIARQIAEALEEAHERGIVHRDLKPANVKVTPDGKVKVLDFGLAKAWAGESAASGASVDLSQSPTLAHTGTQAGVILGTAAYMSPEQARGRPVDKRADIWAFGVVLHEMLTGKLLFGGDTVSDVLAGVLKSEIDLGALPAGTPGTIRQLLRRCLERDPKKRLRDIGEARIAFEEPLPPQQGPGATPSWRSPRTWAIAIAGGLVLFAAGWLLRPAPRLEDAPIRKVDLSIAGLDATLGYMPSISPDGTRVVYVAGGHLRVRRLDGEDALDLPETDNGRYVSWSPDSKTLAFTRNERAWKVSSEGGQPTDLGAVPVDLVGSGGSAWTGDGQVVFAGSDTVGLWAVPAAGGPGRELLALDRNAEADFHEIAALPEGRGLIFTVHRTGQPPDTIALLAGGSRRVLVQVPGESLRQPVYSPTGHLVYERETTTPGIWAVPFSLDRLETTGTPFLVVPGGSAPSVARDGTLCMVRHDAGTIELVRVSRSGAVETVAQLAGTDTSMLMRVPAATTFRGSGGLSLSPDGGRVALSLGYSAGGLFVFDLGRGSLSELASDVFPIRPVWTDGGERLAYASEHGARAWNLWSRRADGAEAEERLSTSGELQLPLALSPDGAHLVYMEGSGPKGRLMVTSPAPGSQAHPLFRGQVAGGAASFSPDGRWLAYESWESERSDVFVRPFPEGDERFQLSTDGGEAPIWARNGEVFYLANGGLWSVAVASRGGGLAISKPTRLFRTGGDTHLASPFDVTPDGQRFFMLRVRGSAHVSLILNWPRELARRAASEGARQQR
jgi:Tol biopolymer transport system component/tRNA A-37 threonylcarbamoyl transferase component Bud32